MSLLQLDSSTHYAFQNFHYYMFLIFVLVQQALRKEEFNFIHQKYLTPMFSFQIYRWEWEWEVGSGLIAK